MNEDQILVMVTGFGLIMVIWLEVVIRAQREVRNHRLLIKLLEHYRSQGAGHPSPVVRRLYKANHHGDVDEMIRAMRTGSQFNPYAAERLAVGADALQYVLDLAGACEVLDQEKGNEDQENQ